MQYVSLGLYTSPSDKVMHAVWVRPAIFSVYGARLWALETATSQKYAIHCQKGKYSVLV